MVNMPLRGAFGAALVSGLLMAAGCSANSAPTLADATSNASATVTTPAAPSAPAPAGAVVAAASLAGEADIADNFDLSTWLIPGEAPVASVDEVGAFRFTCLAGQVSRDDPIVYPGQPGKSHLHQFFGNTGTNASSNYQSLRTTGGSTCTRSTDVSPQRSAYWMPAMMDGAGNVVKPDWINTYYKEMPASDPNCGVTVNPANLAIDPNVVGRCVPIPNGIRFILGYNMTTGVGGPADLKSRDHEAMGFDCMDRPVGAHSYTGTQRSIAAILATGKCPPGAWLRMYVAFPQCWDGKNLDTADHRSHIVMPPQAICPDDHPFRIPEIAVSAFFSVDDNFFAGNWHLSSDEMMPGTVAGSTLHMDYWEAWSPVIKNLWQTNCINGHLTCSTGNVGDGRMVKGMQQTTALPNHELVPVASIP